MANNRGGIPMYNENPQYSATISSQLPQGSPAMFGTQVAKEMAGMGDAIGKWGTNLVKLALEQQEKADDNYVMRRENEMRKALNELMYNPQTGLTNQKLHNAQGVTMAFDDEVEKLTQQFMSDVNNPNLQAKFQQRIGQWIPGYRTTVAKHEGDEIFNARKTDYATNTKDQTDEFVANPSREGVARYYQGLQMNKSYLINTLGLSPEAAEEEIQSNFSKGVLLAGEKFVGLGDTQGILDLRNAVHGKVSAETETKLATMAGKIESQMKGIQKAKAILNDPRFKNPDGTYNVAALKEFEKLHGKGSTRIERVMVGGERQGAANAWAAYDVFKAAGYDDNAIAGILGRLQQEHNFSTEMAEEHDVPGIGRVGGFGMFQWQMDWNYGGRGNTMKQWAADNGLDPNDAKVQSQYALKEALDYGLTPEALNGKSAEEVADIWTRDWEGGKPGEERRYAREWRERITAASKGGHYEERTVSNYNEQEYNEGYKYITEQIQFSKAEHDDKIKNAITQARLEAKSAVTQSELWNIAHKYADNETDAQTIYADIGSWRIDLKEQDENRERRKKDEADNWDNFLGWWVNNADADPSTVRATAAQYHIGNAHMAEVLRSKGLGASGKGSDWAKGGNLKTFDWMAEKYKLTADEKVYVWQKINNANEQSIADTGAPLDEGQIKSIMDHEAASIKVNPSGVFDRAKAWWNGESKIDSGHRFAEAPLGFEPIDTKPGWFRTPDNDEVHWVEGKGWTNVK